MSHKSPALTATQLAPPRPQHELLMQQYMLVAPPLGDDTAFRLGSRSSNICNPRGPSLANPSHLTDKSLVRDP
jgi:hypothetical protein